MGREETSSLRDSMRRSIHDQRHEEHRERKELRFELDDKERDLARRVVLSVRVRVCERQGGQKRVRIEEVACKHLYAKSAPTCFTQIRVSQSDWIE